jgi:type I restriction enzyme S subunit
MTWTRTRVDRVATVNARIGWKALTASEYQTEGYAFLSTPNIKHDTIDFDNVNYITEYRYEESPELKLRIGDVLLVKDGMTLGITNVVRHLPRLSTVNGSIAVLRPFPLVIEPRFLRYSLAGSATQSMIQALKDGMDILHLFQRDIKKLPIDLPPINEQRRIADFLDAETARIDAIMASRRAQVAILDELELARIGEQLSACSQTVGPVYAYYEVQLGKKLNAATTSGDGQAQYLRNANVHWYEIDTSDMATMSFEPAERRFYALRAGDLLVCEGGAGVAEAAVWDGRYTACFYQMSLHRVRSRKQVPVEWLMYWLRYAKAIGVFNADGKLATIPHLTAEQLAEYRIPIPEDGPRRVAKLSAEIAAIRETQRKMAAADVLLAERRQALITAAVTGGIAV